MAQPNIILIMADNQQARTLGCYANPEVHSPNLDALAASGMRFDQAWCPNAFCSPSRASVLTGMLPSQHGVHSWIDDRNMQDWPRGWHALAGIETLPERLRRLGYRTGLFGKYHLGETATPGAGWDDWVTMEHGHVRSFYANGIIDNGRQYEQPGHSVDFFTDKAVDFIGRQTGPYFAFVPFPAPYGHWPATNDGNRNRFSALYDDCPVDSIPRGPISAQAVAHYDRIKAQSGGGLDFSMLMRAPNDLATLRNYFSQITLIDDAVGRIMAADPDALIIYTADHGLSLGQHGFWGHGAATWPSNMHRAAHSVPLIVRAPGALLGAPVGVSVDRQVSNMDLHATILDLLGDEPDPARPSRSFAPLLRGSLSPGPDPDEVFAEQEETRVIRTPRWAYFKRFRGPGADFGDALFDLSADPDETRNLAQDPAHAGVVADLSARIDTYFARYADPRADLWHGGRPIQNSTMRSFWQKAWGKDWAPVYGYA